MDLEPSSLLYEDDLPLSDVAVAPSGAMCCLRRIPDYAEVLVWEGDPSGAPRSWTGAPRHRLLAIFGFDGRELYGYDETSIVRIRPDGVDVVWESAAEMRWPALSPDRTRLLWIENAHRRSLCCLDLDDGLVRRSKAGDCLHAAWLDDGRIVAVHLASDGRGDISNSIRLHDGDGRESAEIVSTAEWALSVHAGGGAGFLASGSEYRFQKELRRAVKSRRDATWSFGIDPLAAECIANVLPAWRSVAISRGAWLFSSARGQTGSSSTLVAAAHGRLRAAHVRAFIPRLAMSGAFLIHPLAAGSRWALHRLSLEAMLPG